MSPELEQMKKEAESEVDDIVRCMAEINSTGFGVKQGEKKINIIEDYMDSDQIPN